MAETGERIGHRLPGMSTGNPPKPVLSLTAPDLRPAHIVSWRIRSVQGPAPRLHPNRRAAAGRRAAGEDRVVHGPRRGGRSRWLPYHSIFPGRDGTAAGTTVSVR